MKVGFRVRAFATHLIVGFSVFVLVVELLSSVWFPFGTMSLAGGWQGLWIALAVDVILGPFLTFVVMSPLKGRRQKIIDMAVIVVIQLVALGFGLYNIQNVRPQYLVHVYDTFYTISKNALVANGVGFSSLSWFERPAIYYFPVGAGYSEFVANDLNSVFNGGVSAQYLVDDFQLLPDSDHYLRSIFHSDQIGLKVGADVSDWKIQKFKSDYYNGFVTYTLGQSVFKAYKF